MLFNTTDLPGVVVLEPEPIADERGFFARTYCAAEFARRDVEFTPVQSSISHNVRSGTLRGLHYQIAPHAERKLVRCTLGAAYDVAVDIRPGSPTFGRWIAVELTVSNMRSLFIPEGFAHGFQTLVDNTEMEYLISAGYEPDSQRGIRWDDPLIAIEWPTADQRVLSERDRELPYLERARES